MDGVIAGERRWKMDEIVEWYRFAIIVSGVASKEETSPLLIGGRWQHAVIKLAIYVDYVTSLWIVKMCEVHHALFFMWHTSNFMINKAHFLLWSSYTECNIVTMLYVSNAWLLQSLW